MYIRCQSLLIVTATYAMGSSGF